jgi:hypothetical protein
MTAIAHVIFRTTGRRIDLENLGGDVIFGGIMLVVAMFATVTYGLDLSWGLF